MTANASLTSTPVALKIGTTQRRFERQSTLEVNTTSV